MRCPSDGPAEYRTEHLRTLTDIEAIRLRPGMYIGNTDAGGLHHILFGLVTSALREFSHGNGRSVRVGLRADNTVEVVDDAPPTRAGDPELEFLFTRVYGHNPNPGGRDWLCYATASALSEHLTVRARSPGITYQHTFRRGVTHAVLQSGGPPDDRGLMVRFRPDPEIFGTARFDPGAIRDRLRQYAFLNSGVRITFSDEAAGTSDEFEYADGIREYVQWLNADRTPLHPDVIVIRGEDEGVRYEVGLQWCAEAEEVRVAFANDRYLPLGGTHVSGVRTGVTRTLNQLIREQFSREQIVTGDDARSGLTAVVSVRMDQPMFLGATRSHLGNPEAERVLAADVGRFLRDYFEANREVTKRVVRNAIVARAARKRK
jgi:DNA gyrase subunit B